MPDRNAWNRRYDTPDFIHGVDASEFLLSNLYGVSSPQLAASVYWMSEPLHP
jgi:hypothetical protein